MGKSFGIPVNEWSDVVLTCICVKHDKLNATPTFEFIPKHGVLFENVFVEIRKPTRKFYQENAHVS